MRIHKDLRRILLTGLMTFAISVALGTASKVFLSKLTFLLSSIVLLFIILVGIAFDIIGTAVTAADERPFHSMAAKKVKGAKQTINLIRNADKVANFCNDMVGDICGTISGAVGAGLIFVLVSQRSTLNEPILSTIMVGLVAALTVSGKAAGKGYALNNADKVMFVVGKLISWRDDHSKTNGAKKKKRKEASNRHDK